MQKKIIAAAIAAAVSAPVFAENSNINVYGVLHADLESVRNDKAAAATGLNRIVSNASRLGVRGREDLGDGLAAIWQLEAQFDLTNSGGTPFASTRNSQVGLEGGFGTAFYGNWDTPYKVAHNRVELFDNTHTASALDLTGRVGTANGNASFNTRQKNVLQYWTPSFNGFQAKLAYAPDNTKKASVAAGGDKSVWSLSAAYENDALYAAYAYEAHRDALSTAASLTDAAHRLVGAYKIGSGQVGLTVERLSVATAVGSTATSSRNGWELSGKYRFGANSLGAFYSRAGDLGGVANTGANQYSLRYGYNLSKRTELYGFYTALSNDAAASYNFSANTTVASAAGAAGLGAKLSGFGLGLAHSF
ncbi:porin [Candidatus Ferrigenium straubiae]|jgi:predicted porin|uniref:porin n=1 Tax=Candidatus Ferrigenium straubiae TaxID=2919506 RepID=UPI003F4AB6C3